jgi:hypothetical protein
MELKTQNLKELYEKDFYLWVIENLKILKNREYDLVELGKPPRGDRGYGKEGTKKPDKPYGSYNGASLQVGKLQGGDLCG